MINAQRLFSLQSLLDECIINAQIFSTIGHEEVVLCAAFLDLSSCLVRMSVLSTRKRNDHVVLKYKLLFD